MSAGEWREVTTDDVLGALNGAELAVFDGLLGDLAGDDSDVLTGIIETVVRRVRGQIAACSQNSGLMASGLTVPESMIGDLVAIVRFRLLTRLDETPSEGRKIEYDDAIDFFEDVAACKVAVPSGVDLNDEDAGVPLATPRITTGTRNFKRSQQDGI